MAQKRKRYPAKLKAKIVLEMLKETRAASELASEYGVHPSVLHRWRREALAKLPELFAEESNWRKEKAQYDAKIDELYTEIGRLSTQLSWLKKKGLDFESE